MMRISAGGEVYNGRTAVELVSHMRSVFNRFKEKKEKAVSNEEYMKKMSERFRKLLGKEVVYDGTTEEDKCLSFIRSMVNGGLAEEVT